MSFMSTHSGDMWDKQLSYSRYCTWRWSLCHSWSFMVINFRMNQCGYLLADNTNWHPISQHFLFIAKYRWIYYFWHRVMLFSALVLCNLYEYRHTLHTAKKLHFIDYISVTDSMSLALSSSTQVTLKSNIFSVIMQNNGNYAIHGHSRSLNWVYDYRLLCLLPVWRVYPSPDLAVTFNRTNSKKIYIVKRISVPEMLLKT